MYAIEYLHARTIDLKRPPLSPPPQVALSQRTTSRSRMGRGPSHLVVIAHGEPPKAATRLPPKLDTGVSRVLISAGGAPCAKPPSGCSYSRNRPLAGWLGWQDY